LKIHNTAIVHPKAILADDVEVDCYAQIGENVQIGAGSRIGAFAVITGWTFIGERCNIHMGAVIGHVPQDKKYRGEKSFVIIGDDNVIREYVTVHRANAEGEATKIGDRNFIMANAHIAHNCQIGNEVIITNFAGLTGHVVVEDNAVISGLAAIHQFVRIGKLAMVGGSSKVVKDVPPYFLADGHPARIFGLNQEGLKRAGISTEVRNNLKRAYKLLYRSTLNVEEALKRIMEDIPNCEEIEHLVNFIRSSKRGICSGAKK
jgi:UDP-N-acetylglucosamine acyltransferase